MTGKMRTGEAADQIRMIGLQKNPGETNGHFDL